jgi:hypothetical protein
METNRSDERPAAGRVEGPASVDPQVLEALRSALTALANPQKTPGGTGALDSSRSEEKRVSKRTGVWEDFWKIAAALLVAGVAVLGLRAYHELTQFQSQVRSDMAEVRTKLARMKSQTVRREDFNSRSLAAHTLIKGVLADNLAAVTLLEDRNRAQDKALARLSEELQELERTANRFEQQRQRAREQREGTSRPRKP